jgi:hypothetical protein
MGRVVNRMETKIQTQKKNHPAGTKNLGSEWTVPILLVELRDLVTISVDTNRLSIRFI